MLSSFVPFYWVAAILGIVGLILGLIGYGRFQRSEATNATMALWGIITSAVAVVLSVVGVVSFMIGSADRSDEPSVEGEGTGSPAAETSAPARGEPRRSPKRSTSTTSRWATVLPMWQDGFTVQTVPCSEPHGEEVFAAA